MKHWAETVEEALRGIEREEKKAKRRNKAHVLKQLAECEEETGEARPLQHPKLQA